MSPSSTEPLSPQERELAERLALAHPVAGPSAALDARVLAAAHAAAGGHDRRSRPRRWPAAIGIAAALVLAVGVVWQLRPMPETLPARGENPSAAAEAVRVGPSPAADATLSAAPAAADKAAAATSQVAETRLIQPAASPAALAEPTAPPTPPSPPSPPGPAPARAPSVVPSVAAPTPAIVEPATPSTTPAEKSRRPQAFQALPAPAAASRAAAAPEAVKPARPAAAAPPARVDTPSRKMRLAPTPDASADRLTGQSQARTLTINDLPVSSDRQLRPAAWLERVRQRLDAGDRQAARKSLRLFRLAHPQHRLPDDLRALADDE